MPRRGGKRKKTRTHEVPGSAQAAAATAAIEGKEDVPRSIVAKASKVSAYVGELVRDLRRLMGPHTTNNLREKRYNRMKDYAVVAGQLGVSHIVVVSQTNSNVVLRVARHPDGPTLHFKIERYSLARQVRALQKRPFESTTAFMTAPLVVLNNFSQSEESHVRLMKVTFQHMFPTINVKSVKLSECRRVVLFHFNKEEGTVELRHYAIRATPVGISRSVKRILQSKVPNLGELEDVSEFIENSAGLGAMSDSEGEDEYSRVTLPDRFIGKGNAKAQQSAMKLSELGPRITLNIFKVEQGVNEGDVLYHKFVHKSAEEAASIKAKITKAKQLKEQRIAIQTANVKRKQEAKEKLKAEKMERKRQRMEESGDVGSRTGGDDGSDADEEEGGDDDGEEEDKSEDNDQRNLYDEDIDGDESDGDESDDYGDTDDDNN